MSKYNVFNRERFFKLLLLLFFFAHLLYVTNQIKLEQVGKNPDCQKIAKKWSLNKNRNLGSECISVLFYAQQQGTRDIKRTRDGIAVVV